MSSPKLQFVSEAIAPGDATFDVAGMSRGEPGLPLSFTWRDSELRISKIIKTWRSLREDRGDQYLAKHWYEVELADGRSARLYFERHAKSHQPRWWLYTISAA